MEPERFSLEKGTLEEWLKERDPKSFPNFNQDKGDLPFQERYEEIKKILKPYQKSIEKEALLQSIRKREEFIRKKSGKLSRKEFDKELEKYPLYYLNNHGPGHVEKVIEKASEILIEFPKCKLNAYEGYLLLCAIQFHDIGNIFGREEHEKKIKEIMEQKCKQILRDRPERILIAKIAMVHGGLINNDRDTIKYLKEDQLMFAQPVNERLLAAILRFSDELADDYTRADKNALEMDSLPEESKMYHKYSETLHSVKLEINPENKKHCVRLEFDFDASDAFKIFKKNGIDIYLLDEIYNRTLKMERERRYCMRFLRPNISIEQIRVGISIQNPKSETERDEIKYTLEEKGYPDEPSDIKTYSTALRSGEEEAKYLKKIWGLEK
jgi:hypothetical protein